MASWTPLVLWRKFSTCITHFITKRKSADPDPDIIANISRYEHFRAVSYESLTQSGGDGTNSSSSGAPLLNGHRVLLSKKIIV